MDVGLWPVFVRHNAREWGHGERVSEGDSEPSTEHGRPGYVERVSDHGKQHIGQVGVTVWK